MTLSVPSGREDSGSNLPDPASAASGEMESAPPSDGPIGRQTARSFAHLFLRKIPRMYSTDISRIRGSVSSNCGPLREIEPSLLRTSA